ncbi:hypothetical protein RHGRI_033037 [Rhododendron griersonianum]|uniref:Rhamnogalacturonan endolyase n=1 Tax=Rhododendron griersonianum TaxID=479676 RepID=A0AAV6HXW3_9ERIC|nr:hypothetical protein RHGRI_033037 [Rhododendron griersonianum]
MNDFTADNVWERNTYQASRYQQTFGQRNPHNDYGNGIMFTSLHYAGYDLGQKIGQGEAWKKVFGPVFIYLNSVVGGESRDDTLTLWEDAKRLQMMAEVQSWPYTFPASKDFPSSDQRGNVNGRLLVRDRFISKDYISAKGAYVGLAPPGDVGSWQRESKGYQFWTRADENGNFSINHVRTGDYNLYAWVPGFIGDYRNDVPVTITPGCYIHLGHLVYEPPRDGPTLFRQYGLWERYAELYPKEDLVFFAQVTRRKNDNTLQGTTWQIRFKLDRVDETGTYKLKVALASANLGELQVRVNDPNTKRPLFSSGLIGRDNAVVRHGIHGLYWLFNVEIPNAVLVKGRIRFI